MEKSEMKDHVRTSIDFPTRKNKRPWLFFFFGVPGSGKSQLAAQLNTMFPSVILSTDQIALQYQLDRSENYHWCFEIADELTAEFLQQGYSVVLDSNLDKVRLRRKACQMAQSAGASSLGFWVDTKKETLLKRQEDRRSRHDLRGQSLFYVPEEELDLYEAAIELPEADEPVYRLDGEQDFETQLDQLFQELNIKFTI